MQLSETGSGEVVKDNTGTIMTALAAKGGSMAPPAKAPDPGLGMPIGGYATAPSKASGSGCSVGPAKESNLALGVMAAAVALVSGGAARRKRDARRAWRR